MQSLNNHKTNNVTILYASITLKLMIEYFHCSPMIYEWPIQFILFSMKSSIKGHKCISIFKKKRSQEFLL